MISTLRIATRNSPLARWQTNHVIQRINRLYPNLTIDIIPIITQGDIMLDTPLAKIGGKGLFVKQLETAILEREADIAVHSVKDIPMQFPQGLELITICKRDDPRDAFISNHYASLMQIPAGGIIGTSSLRRQCQLRRLRPDLTIHDLRGNVETRLKKLDNNQYDAVILAASGLTRLNLQNRITHYLSTDLFLPAVGQGAIGIEARTNDKEIKRLLAHLEHLPTRICVTAERAMNKTLNGGCQVPIACHSLLYNNNRLLRLSALVGSLDGSTIIFRQLQANASDAEQIGQRLGEELLKQGADQLLKQVGLDHFV